LSCNRQLKFGEILRDNWNFYFNPLASDSGIFGLNGFTLTRNLAGSIIKSIALALLGYGAKNRA